MNQAGLTEEFWAKTIKHAADVYNHIAMPALNMRASMEALLGTVPRNSRLRIFGCEPYFHMPTTNREIIFVQRAGNGVYMENDHG